MKLTNEEKQKVEDNLALVNYILKKHSFARTGSYDDYFQEGVYGLCLAAKRYDKNKGTEFSTYAASYINGYLLKHYRDFSQGPIRPTRSSFANKNKPNYLYIDGLINEETGDCYGYDFIDVGVNEEDESIANLSLKEINKSLNKNEKAILELSLKNVTQRDIGDRINLSQAQVSRIKKNLKTKINSFLGS